MTRNSQLVLGVALIVAGLLLALAWPDTEFLWFRGRPLGVVLAVIGGFDLFAGLVGPRAGRREGGRSRP